MMGAASPSSPTRQDGALASPLHEEGSAQDGAEQQKEEKEEKEEEEVDEANGTLAGLTLVQRIAALNRRGLWPKACGVNVQALAGLRELPLKRAFELIRGLEDNAEKVPNPSAYLMLAMKVPVVPKARITAIIAGGQGAGKALKGAGKGPKGKGIAEALDEEFHVFSKKPNLEKEIATLREREPELTDAALAALHKLTERDAVSVIREFNDRPAEVSASKYIVHSVERFLSTMEVSTAPDGEPTAPPTTAKSDKLCTPAIFRLRFLQAIKDEEDRKAKKGKGKGKGKGKDDKGKGKDDKGKSKGGGGH
eukprot:NODE_9175_length_1442_cov_3.281369.p1 GENE.NODE_9175_length_1442_cov_3.281369~~NODE_9175_length_1442_cov_3.281369.p1  ORF type:complete len:340 (+),score=120.28 NODE_9175_length_1442_cov_3.281369:99-1022(+)